MNPFFRLLAVTTLPLLVFGCVSTATHQKSLDEIANQGKSIDNLKGQLSEQQKQNDQCVSDKNECARQLTLCQKDSADQKQSLERAQADIARLERVLTDRNLETGKALTEMRQSITRLTDENRAGADEQQRLSTENQRLTAHNAELQKQLEEEKQARVAQLEQLKSTYGQLLDKMSSEIERGEVTISELQGRLTVNLVERIIFDSGSAEVKSGGKDVLRKVGAILSEVKDKEIRVEGHTDNVPISSKLQAVYPSNWDLSSARAINVLQFLRSTVGIPGERLVACGFGEFRPLADNGTPEGRAQNRRIQIVLVPLDGSKVEPATAK